MEQKFPIKILIFETTKYQLQRETKDLCKLFLNYFPGTKGFDNRREIYILSFYWINQVKLTMLILVKQ